MTRSPDEAPPSDSPQSNLREVRFRHTSNVPDLLRKLRCSLLVSTYQAGKLLAIGTTDAGLHFSFHNFDQVMGLAVSPRRLAIATKGQIWFLDGQHDMAPTLAPAGRFERAYLARSAAVTGSIHCHEIAWDASGQLWIVNTLFSCLATLHPEFSFVPQWQPPFITDLAGEDRCHLNGFAMQNGKPAYVTMLAASNEPAGWRPTKESSGIVMDVATQEPVARGFAMPHSPRWHQDQLWVLNSGHGGLETVDASSGRREVVEQLPGYTRGLDFRGQVAFVGLSRIRETAVFGGLPISESKERLRCGVAIVDTDAGRTIGTIEFEAGVEEIFDVRVVPDAQCVALRGPRPSDDDDADVWVVPRPDEVAGL